MTERDRKAVEADEVAFFARYYENGTYNSTGWRLRLHRELRSLLRASGTERLKRVLSVGCGDGQFELLLAPFAERITALDISPPAIKIAKRNAAQAGIANVDFRCQSICEINWEEQFDTIVCLAFLHHVLQSDLPEFLRQVYELLKPGGFFYSQDPNMHGVLRKIGRVVLGANYGNYHTANERELDPKELTEVLRSVGFDSVKIGYIDFTVIPVQYLLSKRAGWPLYLCLVVDWLWCHSPFARWASGFTAIARKRG